MATFKTVHEAESHYQDYTPGGLESARDVAQQAAQRVLEAKYFREFFAKHADVAPNLANEGIMRAFLADVEVTAGALEEAYQILVNQKLSPLALRDERTLAANEAEHREQLIQQILDEGPDSSAVMQTILNRASTEDLHQRLENIREERRLRSLPIEELRRLAREDAQRKNPAPQFPPIKPEWTSAVIRAASVQQIRTLIRMHGEERVNNRINNID